MRLAGRADVNNSRSPLEILTERRKRHVEDWDDSASRYKAPMIDPVK
jgi:hypothetical protein